MTVSGGLIIDGLTSTFGTATAGRIAVAGSLAIIILAVSYNSGMFALSRRRTEKPIAPTGSRTYVFLLACLNEERVITESLTRIIRLPLDDLLVLVVDDASDDGTAAAVRDMASPHVHLYTREFPDARKGKGAALNAGLRWLRKSDLLQGKDPNDIIVCVVDADGRLDGHAVEQVDPFFDDPKTGAVQVGVRMYNRRRRLLARLQDMEFVVYGEIFQNARRHLGSVGMGGNGQFMRLAALESLPGKAWSDCLTEDLDLGVRLLAAGWINGFCPTAAVHQQAVLTLGRLLRQRSRWFQGHLQAFRLVPLILRRIPARSAIDLIYHLSSPALLLLTSLLPIAFMIMIGDAVVASFQAGHSLLSPWWLPWFYLMTFGMAAAYAFVYRKREPVSWAFALLLGHIYVIYGYIWFVSGWWALARALTGKHTWLKTART
ncbi:glycosyltransferase family 2 protein [Actinomadura rudentiformis]|uniref:Glycosyltransferase family 2 protein n=1 Tax=Actinomadura rudentiformis TaxID=359158 RepID=A0A6H9YI46_9ACTN|nr:glycosyltransferase family 2 protein [Actinomadura rudentiformis]KAB2339317.1 glycosyltransferase family 2 protein [Actinomadura rudentiformis]